MPLQKALLEHWMRQYYFSTSYDLGSSGIKNFSLNELFGLIGLKTNDLDTIRFDDSDTWGNHELRQCIANRWGDGDHSSVMVGNGSNEVIYTLLNTLLSCDDEVIVLHPIYHTLGKLAETITGNVKEWVLDPADDFQPNLENLKTLITQKTRMVIVNFPHNPTGVSISKSQLNELIDIVSSVDAYLVWDAAFQDIVHHGESLPNPYLQYKKTVYIGTFSKSYGLAGLRIGWCISSPMIISKCDIIKDYTSLYVSPLNEFIAINVIKNLEKILDNVVPEIRVNYEKLEAWLCNHTSKVSGKLPQGGVCAFLKILGCTNTQDFCKKLAEEKKVLLVPGVCFDSPEYVRIGFGSLTQTFEEGLSILSDSL